MFKIVNDGKLPERATRYSAGFDVFANEDTVIGAGETKVIGLGIALDDISDYIVNEFAHASCFKASEFKELHYLELHPRSSLRAKGLGGGVGIIDMDYRDEIKIVISNPLITIKKCYNGSDSIYSKEVHVDSMHKITRGDKIGQLILKRHEGWLLPAEYTKDKERVGGFGSTDAL